MPATRGLLGDYLRLLDRYRVVNQVLRIDPQAARVLVDDLGGTVVGDPDEPIAGLPIDMHPVLPAIDRARLALEEAVTSSGREFAAPVLVALFPTGAFNAQTRMTEHGYLVLLNRGLLELLRRLAKTSVASTGIGPRPPELMPQDALNTIGRALWQYLERPHHPAPMPADLDRYDLFGVDSSAARPDDQSLVAEDVARVGALVNESAVRFAVAHEFAHILEGHITLERQRPVATEAGSVELAKKRIDEEFEADAHGFFMVLAAAERSIAKAPEHEAMLRYTTTFAGPLLFFTTQRILSNLQERVPEGFHGLTGADHPSPEDRRARIYAIAQRHLESLDAGSLLLDADALDLEEKLVFYEEPLLGELERQWRLHHPRASG